MNPDEIPLRPIEFERKPLIPSEIPPLPSEWSAAEPIVTVGMWESAGHWVWRKYESTAFTLATLNVAILILSTIQQIKEISLMDEKWYLQRRVWAMVCGAIVAILGLFKVAVPEWLNTVGPDLIIQAITALSGALAAVLAIWSYIKPKPSA